jgi:hypothetical protein
MALDPDIPVPLILEQLRGNAAWTLICQRLDALIENRVQWLTNIPADTDAREIQRVIGEIKGMRMVTKEPDRLQRDWAKAHKESTSSTRATR